MLAIVEHIAKNVHTHAASTHLQRNLVYNLAVVTQCPVKHWKFHTVEPKHIQHNGCSYSEIDPSGNAVKQNLLLT